MPSGSRGRIHDRSPAKCARISASASRRRASRLRPRKAWDNASRCAAWVAGRGSAHSAPGSWRIVGDEELRSALVSLRILGEAAYGALQQGGAVAAGRKADAADGRRPIGRITHRLAAAVQFLGGKEEAGADEFGETLAQGVDLQVVPAVLHGVIAEMLFQRTKFLAAENEFDGVCGQRVDGSAVRSLEDRLHRVHPSDAHESSCAANGRRIRGPPFAPAVGAAHLARRRGAAGERRADASRAAACSHFGSFDSGETSDSGCPWTCSWAMPSMI